MDKKSDKETTEHRKPERPREIGSSIPAPHPNNPYLKQIKSKEEFLAIKAAESDDDYY